MPIRDTIFSLLFRVSTLLRSLLCFHSPTVFVAVFLLLLWLLLLLLLFFVVLVATLMLNIRERVNSQLFYSFCRRPRNLKALDCFVTEWLPVIRNWHTAYQHLLVSIYTHTPGHTRIGVAVFLSTHCFCCCCCC